MRRKLFLALLGTAMVSIATVVLILRNTTQSQVHAFVAEGGPWGLQETLKALEAHYAARGSWEDAAQVLATRPASPGAPHRGGLTLTDAQGRILYPPARAGQTWTEAQRRVALPVQVDGRTVGYLIPPLSAHATASSRALFQRLDWAALAAALTALALAAALAWALSNRILRPVHALTAAARRLAQGDLSVRVPESGDEELATLARAFNHMAAALQQAEESRRRLMADIAHELRTPLAVQQAHLEALQDGIYPLTPENLAPVVEQNRLLARLVHDLRTLTLADTGQLSLERDALDVRAWLPRVVEKFRAAAQQRGIALEVDLPSEPAWVHADAARLEQILHNLLGNALRHTPSGGRIEVRAEVMDDEVRIQVRDTGPGLPPGEEEQVFERFYRLDKSRARASGGSGLGLSIARSLARAHGGDLTAANHPQGGAVFTLRLPRAPQPAADAVQPPS